MVRMEKFNHCCFNLRKKIFKIYFNKKIIELFYVKKSLL